MFLALREIKKEKLRYGLIGLVIVLIAYLIFILMGLSNGLASSNRLAIDSWNAKQIILNDDANGSLTESNLTPRQRRAVTQTAGRSDLVQLNVNLETTAQTNRVGSQLLGIDSKQPIYQDLKITSGHKFTNANQVVVDQSIIDQYHYHLGQTVRFANHTKRYQIVGITKNAELNVAPVIYASTAAVQTAKFGSAKQAGISAIVLKKTVSGKVGHGLQRFSMADFVNQLPGYTAQNNTFNFMIGFLLVITLLIVSIFLYVLTIQKIPYLAVLKVQGGSNWVLVKSINAQALIMTVGGLLVSILLTVATAVAMPSAVPMRFDPVLIGLVSILLIGMALIGAIIPVRTVTKVDPATVMGG